MGKIGSLAGNSRFAIVIVFASRFSKHVVGFLSDLEYR